MDHFTRREKNMICIYAPGSRIGLMAELNDMIGYLMPDEKVLLHLAEYVISKLERMTEIKGLETHISNYLKTKDVYAAYRASSHSRSFAAAHKQELALCKAAKTAFDELGLQKLPTIKMLRSEYAELIEKKKQAYRQHRQARDEMRDLLCTKANAEMILEMDKAHRYDPKQQNQTR